VVEQTFKVICAHLRVSASKWVSFFVVPSFRTLDLGDLPTMTRERGPDLGGRPRAGHQVVFRRSPHLRALRVKTPPFRCSELSFQRRSHAMACGVLAGRGNTRTA
jgi:hypothetical protein